MTTILLVSVFIVAMYFLVYSKKAKKNREKMDEINYNGRRRTYAEHRQSIEQRRKTILEHNNYVTKYNSTEDYREK
ncbi:MAG: hypothetical protein GX235_05810 [Clostridiales bacterium]|nr:hypothetical protein [Clostridiales bacterium]